MTVGEKIYVLRKRRGLSQEQLAGEISVSRQTLSKWEMNAAMPDTENILKLSLFFEVSTDYLLKNECGDPDEYARIKSASQVTDAFKLSKKAIQLIDEKGYIGAYIMTALSLPGFLITALICVAYLVVLASVAPLSEFPAPAFILPGATMIIMGLMLIRMTVYMCIARKLKNLQTEIVKDCKR